MRNDYSDISVIQDKSGSMASLRDDTIGGFNSFLAEQKKVTGKCTMSVMQFDTSFNMVVSGQDIQQVQPLTHETYKPEGNTALLDAVAKTIISTGQRLESMKEEERPARVIVLIMTDGEENASHEYGGPEGHKKVMQMIKDQTEKWKWQFIFLGANQDAIKAGEKMGIASANAMSYAANAKGTSRAFAAASSNVKSYRTSAPDDVQKMAFAPSQREEQYDAGATDSLKGKLQEDDADPKKATT